jgi:hypothetical protein
MVAGLDGAITHCPNEAMKRCSSNFRYCEDHAKVHGSDKDPHAFKTIPKKERG